MLNIVDLSNFNPRRCLLEKRDKLNMNELSGVGRTLKSVSAQTEHLLKGNGIEQLPAEIINNITLYHLNDKNDNIIIFYVSYLRLNKHEQKIKYVSSSCKVISK